MKEVLQTVNNGYKIKEKCSDERKSNIELLRIISIIMIIAHHYALYSGFGENQAFLCKIVIDIFSAFGKLGAGLFIIISGYFCEKTNFKLKKLVEFCAKVYFYSIIGLIIGICIDSELLNDGGNIYRTLLPNICGLYWFTTVYAILYLFSPYLKKVLTIFNKKDLKIFLTLMVIVYCFIGMIPRSRMFANEFTYCLLIFIIGGYISKYDFKFLKKNSKKITLILILLQIGLMTSLELLSLKLPIFTSFIRYFNSLNSPLIISLIISIFYDFKKLNIKSNTIINKLAATSFGIYLIHENLFVRDIIWKQIVKGASINNPIVLLLNGIFGVIGVFFVCAVIDLIFSKTIYKYLLNIILKVGTSILNIKAIKNMKERVIKIYE